MNRRLSLLPAILRHPAALVVAIFALSCIGDTSGPGVAKPGLLNLVPYFETQAPHGIVPIDRIHIVLFRPGATTPAIDTVVHITPGATSVDITLSVALFTAADTFTANVEMITTGGQVAFSAQNITVIGIPAQGAGGNTPPPQSPIPLQYVGTGANAASVDIITSPIPSVITGDTIVLTAVAKLANGTVIPGTPIGWISLDTARAKIAFDSLGRVVGRTQRGNARIIAQLLTGPADTVLVPVQLLPAAINVIGGSGQTATVRSLLPQPVVALVKASDSVPVTGVWVKFQSIAGGGTVSPDSALSDATGKATAQWTLGPVAGTQTVKATTPKAPSVQANFAAIGQAGAAVTLAASAGNAQTATVGTAVTVQPAVVLKDADSNVVQGTTVTFVLGAGGGQITGAVQTTDASGIARVGAWQLGTVAGANTLTATILPVPAPEQPAPAANDISPAAASTTVTFTATGAPAAATSLIVSGLSVPTVGVAASVAVAARDQYANVATGYRGTIRFTSTDGPAILPANYTFNAADNGSHAFPGGVTFGTGGIQTVTATDVVTASITGAQTIAVGGGGAATFAITGLPGATVAGPNQTITVTAKNGGGNTVTTYAGTVFFTSTDPLATVPPPYTFQPGDAGAHAFTNGVVFRTAGARTITATDLSQGTITGTSGSVAVSPTTLAFFDVTGVADSTVGGTLYARPGIPFSVTVAAKDTFLNTLPSYAGTITFTAPLDTANPILPLPYAFIPATDQGVHTFTGGVALNTLGSQFVLVADQNAVPGVLGVMVGSGQPATQLAFLAPPVNTVSGATMAPVLVTALDASSAVATGYGGNITLAIGTNPSGGTLSGTKTVAAVNGLATFSDLSIDNIGAGYTLTATAGALTGATSPSFDVTAPAGVISWINAAGGNWSTGANWNTGTPPTPSEIAAIQLNGTYTVTVNTAVTVAGLQLGGTSGTQTLTISGQTLTLNGASTVSANGVINHTGNTLAGTGSLAIGGTWSFTGGTATGTGTTTILPGATWTIDGAGAKYLDGRVVNVAGTATFPSGTGTGTLNFLNAAQLNTTGTGLIDIQTAVDLAQFTGPLSTINNAGTFRKSSGAAGLTVVGANFNNSGLVEVQSDALQFIQGGSSSGAFTIAAGGQLDWGGSGARTLTAGSTVSGAGNFTSSAGTTTLNGSFNITGRTVVTGGTLNFSAASPDTAKTRVLAISSGIQGGTGVLAISDSMIWTGGNLSIAGGVTYLPPGSVGLSDGAAARYLDARQLVVAGTLRFPSGTGVGVLNFLNAAQLNVTASGLVDIQSQADLSHFTGTLSTINNAGTFRKASGAAGPSSIGANFNNTGLVDVVSDALQFLQSGTSSGAFAVAAGAQLDWGGSGTRTLAAGSTVTGAGNFTSSAGTTTVNGGFNITGRTVITGGTVNFTAASPDTANARVLAISGGTQAGIGVLAVTDSLVWTGGNISTAGGVTYLRPGSLSVSDGAAPRYLDARQLVVAGTLTFPSGTGTGALNFLNTAVLSTTASGIIDVQTDASLPHFTGVLSTINNAGTFRKSAGAALSQVGANINNSGLVEVLSGTLQFIQGGASTGVFAIAASGRLDWGGAGTRTLNTGSTVAGAGQMSNSGGTTTVAGSYNVTGRTSVVGGALNFSAASPDTSNTRVLYVNNGTQGGTGVVAVTDSLIWRGGNLATAGGVTYLRPGSASVSDSTPARYLDARQLVVAGALRIPSGTTGAFNFLNAAQLNITPTGLVDIQAASDLPHFTGTLSTINNAGTFRKSSVAAGATVVGANINNSGLVDVASDILQFVQGGTSTGTFTIAAGAQLDWGGSGTRTLSAGSSVSGAGNFTSSAGTTTVSGSYSITGQTQANGGTLNFSAALPDTSFTRVLVVNGGAEGGTGILSASDSMIWMAGTLGQAGSQAHIRAGAALVVQGNGTRYLQSGTLANEGTIVFPASGTGTIQFLNAPTINNLAGGVVDFAADGDFQHFSGGAATFNNQGTIRKSGGSGTSTIADRINHTGGSIDVQTGTLSLPGTATLPTSTMSAPATVAAGATLEFLTNGFDLGNGFSASGTGHVNVTGGTLSAAGATDSVVFRHLALSAGRLGGPGVFHVTDSLVWTGGTMGNNAGRTRIPATGTLYVVGGGTRYLQNHTLFNEGTVRFTAGTTGSIQLYDAPTINNTGTIEFADNASIIHFSGLAGTFNNLGLIQKSGGTGNSTIGDRINHTATGSINVQTGTLILLGAAAAPASTFSAPVTVSAGATVDFNSFAFDVSTGFSASGAGHVTASGANLRTVAGTDSVVFRHVALSAGSIGGPGVFVVADTLDWTGGTMGNNAGRTRIPLGGLLLATGGGTRYLQNHTLFNAGTVRFPLGTTGTIQLYDAPTINNLASGIVDFADNASIIHFSGVAGTFNNLGLIQKSGGTGNSTIGDRFNHTGGSIDVQTGRLTLLGAAAAPASTLSAPVTMAASGTLVFNSNQFDLSNGFTSSGAGHDSIVGANLKAVTVGDSLVFRHLALSAGSIGGPGVFYVTDSLVWTGGTMGNNAGRTRIPTTGTLYAVGGGTRNLQNQTLINAGRVLFPAGTTGSIQLYDAPTITNLATGTVEFADNASIIHFSGAAGAFNNLGTLLKSGGAGTSQVADNFNNNTPTGTVAGVGTIDFTGSFTSTGAVAPGVVAGTTGILAIAAPLPSGSTSALTVEIGGSAAGTGHDQVQVGGTYTFNGTLNASFINGFIPTVGQKFPVLTFTAKAGTGFTALNLPVSDAQLDTLTSTGHATDTLYLVTTAVLPSGIDVIWQGDVSGAWEAASNWNTNLVPGSGQNVYIPLGTPNAPVITNGTSIGDLILQPGATLQVDAQVTISGNLVAGTTITGEGSLTMDGDGKTLTGTLANLIVTGNVALSGPTTVDNLTIGSISDPIANLDIGPYTATVNSQFSTAHAGTLTMQDAAGVLDVAGDITFGGGNATGLITDGLILVHAGFSQIGHDNSGTVNDTVQTFYATGSNVVRFVGTGPQSVSFNTPTDFCVGDCSHPYLGGSQFANVDLQNANGLTFINDILVSGGFTGTTGDIDAGLHELRLGEDLVAPASVNALVLTLGGAFTLGGTLSANTVVFNGLNQSIPDLPYQNLRVVGTGVAASAGSLTTTGDFAAGFTGLFGYTPTGLQFTLNGNLNVSGTVSLHSDALFTFNNHAVNAAFFYVNQHAVPVMAQAGDILTAGDVIFGGESTQDKLTGGELHVTGGFFQGNSVSNTSFLPGPGYQVTFDGTGGSQAVSFASPVESFFQTLSVTNVNGITLFTDVQVAGDLAVAGNITDQAAGYTLTVGGNLSTPSILVGTLNIGGTFTGLPSPYTVGLTNFTGTGQAIPLALPYNGLGVNGTASIAGDLIIDAGLQVLGTLDIGTHVLDVPLNVTVLGSVAGTGAGTLRMTGNGVVLRGTVPNLEVNGNVSINGRTTVNGNVQVAANLDLSSEDLFATGNLTVLPVAGAGITMVNGAQAETLSVNNISFQNTTADLTISGGTILVAGDFADAEGGPGFLASGGNYVVITGAGAHSIYMPYGGTGAQFANLKIENGAVVNAITDVLATNTLEITGAGSLYDPGTSSTFVGTTLITANGGVIQETSPSAVIGVSVDALLNGGSTAGLLTNGLLSVGEDIQATAGSFAPSGAHLTVLNGTIAQTVDLQGGSQFNDLLINNTAGLVIGSDSIVVAGSLTNNGAAISMASGSTERNVHVLGTYGDIAASSVALNRLEVGGDIATGGVLTLDTLAVGGTLAYLGSTYDPLVTEFTGSAQTINAVAGGYHDVLVSGTSVTLSSPVLADGQLMTPAGATVTRTIDGAGNLLTVAGLDADGLVFDNAPLQVVNGDALTRFDNATFQNMDPTVEQFRLDRQADVVTFNNVTFSTTPTSGVYLHLVDTDAIATIFTVTMSGTSPTNHGGKATTGGNASLLGWAP